MGTPDNDNSETILEVENSHGTDGAKPIPPLNSSKLIIYNFEIMIH